ncbi:ATP-binding protein, partial [Xanthomonas perforans]
MTGALTQVIRVEEGTQVGQVRREAVALAQACGFDEDGCGRVALVATELCTNLLNHAGGGQMQLCSVAGRDGLGIELCTLDQGRGFVLADCLPDGYSTGSTPGNGLGTVQRHAALLDAYSDARGAVVLARVYADADSMPDLPYGALRVPLQNETVCGDGWHLAIDAQGVTVSMIDGLGHGAGAADAADAGTRAAAAARGEPGERIARLHAGMSGTRGGAAAVLQFDPGGGQVRFAGGGNIG